MEFRVTARTILQLGAELISSDAIAFYELIKNAIDANSPEVEVDIVTRLSHDVYRAIRDELSQHQKVARTEEADFLAAIKERIKSRLAPEGHDLNAYLAQLDSANATDELVMVLDEANYITIKDTGEGMSLTDLKDVYLTIGTRSRFIQRTSKDGKLYLGEKGIGRLSTMRLGDKLYVKTTRSGESHWNILPIDWSRFSHESDELLQDIQLQPEVGEPKTSKRASGTVIRLSALTSKWDSTKVQELVNEDFSRFSDPFNPKNKYPIRVFYNDEPFVVPDFDRSIFKYAHATVEAEFNVRDEPADDENRVRLRGRVNYRLREMKKSFDLNAADAKSATQVASLETLERLGPFTMRAYWYNRPLIRASSGIPNFQYVKKTVNAWAGGLMVYRDGFRVHPYGGPDDDWLDLDKKALSSGGYKVNRRQIIGKVDISSKGNPQLIDQTNREGLRGSDEKRALVKLLKHVLETEMRAFLNSVEKNIYHKEQLDLNALAKRVDHEVKSAIHNVRELVDKLPEPKNEVEVVTRIQQSFKHIQESMSQAKKIANSYKQGRQETVHLAGIGLMVEMLAHELNRAAENALATLNESKQRDLPVEVKVHFKVLESQMKTLQKRLKILDPLSTTGRQRKETFELVSWVNETLSEHSTQFRQNNIRTTITVLPKASSTLRVKMVKGMIVQVLENLISNSVYWLRQQRELDKSFSPKIDIVIDTQSQEIDFTDNGPGVELGRREEIFLPFVTLKPAGQGKGLGLYIAREIANYHDAKLYLSEVPSIHKRRLNTFIFAFGATND
jgi:signal transduction histidine kinase